MSAPPVAFVYDSIKIAAAMRQHFPDMPEHVIVAVVNLGAEVAQLLANARGARLAARGAEWQQMDCIGEALALLFNLASMANAGPEAQQMMTLISCAIRGVYGRAPAVEPEPEAGPKLN